MKHARKGLIAVGLLCVIAVGVGAAARPDVRTWLQGFRARMAPVVGKPAPELPLDLPVIGGGPVQLADLRGRVVLLHFFSYG